MALRDVDDYLKHSTLWPAEIAVLRPILLGCGLSEEVKWGKPCYHHEGRNIAIIQEMKEFLALMFFKGALLDDPAGVLEEQGPNTRSARRMCFRSTDEVVSHRRLIESYVQQAIAIERSGATVAAAPPLELVTELQARLDGDVALREAFMALTPGRRREYHLHISGAKQAATRESRIDACIPRIMAGKGLRDR